MVTNRNNGTLENHEQITLNKDDDIGGSQIPVMWQMYFKQVHLCKIDACIAFLFCSLSGAANPCILMKSCYVIILVQCNLLWILKSL